ncbi:uncharacterized protein LOC111346415 [Stylophora pistillata]|uniref:uncharacterized protein LOC111346415 n=1 Tax=Stylophora pistillata TaxID=50429 RepID=UPI000C04A27B|nr:uncharacterized protein LOC111346415 [Stylophora pistillata]
MFNECFPLISVRISSRDPPFISPLVKHLLKFRNRLQKRSKPLPVGLEDRINHLIRENQRQAVKQDSSMSGRGSRAWWSTVNTITGRDTQPQLISSVIHPDIINKYFCSINSDPEYIAPAPIDIPDDARIPTIPLHVVTHFLSKLKRTACGPDELPYWLFREFAHDLAPVVTDVFNSSLQQHKVPSSWKMADIKPIPKESPLTCCTQLRPISLTAIIMRLFERLVYRFELSSIFNDYIDLDQFAYRGGHNSTMALIKCQHTWLKWLDGNADFVRIFSFETVDTNLMCCHLTKEDADCDSAYVESFASCETMFKNRAPRKCIWIIGVISLIGAVFVIKWRMVYRETNIAQRIMLIHLAVSDGLMVFI